MVDGRKVAIAAASDALAVVVFAAIGRKSHDESGSVVAGALAVAAPFLLGAAAGWCIAQAWRAPMAWRSGVIIWLTTLAAGLPLRRWVFDRGTALSFIIVATLFLGVALLGWRLVCRLIRSGGRLSASSLAP